MGRVKYSQHVSSAGVDDFEIRRHQQEEHANDHHQFAQNTGTCGKCKCSVERGKHIIYMHSTTAVESICSTRF